MRISKARTKKAKTSFAEIVMTIGILILFYAAFMTLLILGFIGIIVIIAGFAYGTGVPEKALSVLVGLILLAISVTIFKQRIPFTKISLKRKNKSPRYKRLTTFGLLGLFVLAFVVSFPTAVYWTSSAIGAIYTEQNGVETTAKVSIEKVWGYPLTLTNGRLVVFPGKPTSTESASVSFKVGDKEYTSHTMVAETSEVKKGTTSIHYNPKNPAQVSTTTLAFESTIQALLFDAMAIIFGLSSVFSIRAWSKDKEYIYTKK